jgi:hypothetical protein
VNVSLLLSRLFLATLLVDVDVVCPVTLFLSNAFFLQNLLLFYRIGIFKLLPESVNFCSALKNSKLVLFELLLSYIKILQGAFDELDRSLCFFVGFWRNALLACWQLDPVLVNYFPTLSIWKDNNNLTVRFILNEVSVLCLFVRTHKNALTLFLVL